MASFVLTGRFVTSDNIAIPGTSLPEVNFIYVDLLYRDSPELAKSKIEIADDGTFIQLLFFQAIGYATTAEEVVEIVNKFKIYIPETREKIAEYNRPVKIVDKSVAENGDVINGTSRFRTMGKIGVIGLGDIVLEYFTPPISTPPPPPTPTITFFDLPVAPLDPNTTLTTASFFIFKGSN